MIATGVTLPFLYQVIRQLRQIRDFYGMPEHIDLSDLRPPNGFPRYAAALGIMVFLYEALEPLVLDPTAFACRAVVIGSSALTPLILLMFYLPLSAVHRRPASEKESLLAAANARIATMLERIHAAAFDQQDNGDAAGMRAVFTTLKEEKEAVQALRTWPRRPGTLTGLLSALLLPTVLVLIREILSMFPGT